MAVTVFKLIDGFWTRIESEKLGLANTEGWWNVIKAEDLDNDGDQDLVCGNIGQNYKFHATEDKPFQVYCDDYDRNGAMIYCLPNSMVVIWCQCGRQCSSEQIPDISKKFKTYNEFANAKLQDIVGDKIDGGYTFNGKGI